MNGKCRLDGTSLTSVLDLGNIFVSDFVKSPGEGEKFPVNFGVCPKCGLAQLFDSYPPEKMYRQYWYRSATNEQMRKDLQNIVECAKKFVKLLPGDSVLDVGANDGTLLSFYDEDILKIGVDPSQLIEEVPTDFVKEPRLLIRDFFNEDVALGINTRPKVITSIAMFYDIEDPISFSKLVYDTLHDDGVWILQLSYTPLMLRQNAWDNIGHEHIMYYTLSTIKKALYPLFNIVDVELNNVNCGSFRLYVMKSTKTLTKHDVCIGAMKHDSLMYFENLHKFTSDIPYQSLPERLEKSKSNLIDFLQKNKGRVLGLGASTKGNTLLQVCGITPELLPAIADRQPQKWGLYTVGTNIPIISDDEMRARKPEYLLVLPWTFINTMCMREADLIKSGTKLVVPLPEVEIYG